MRRGVYEVVVEGSFSAAHNLRGYEGDCERLHGHNWRVEAAIAGSKLDKTGMLIDFRVAKKALKEVLDTLDHRYLNEIAPFDKVNPSTENLANYVAQRVARSLPKGRVKVSWVRIWEGPTTRATYFAEI